MIDFIEGDLLELDLGSCVIGVNGMGYRVNISTNTYRKILDTSKVQLKVHLNIRDDAIVLYGFGSVDERELFNLLINVTGIGPKAAMSILSEFSVVEFCGHIAREDIKSLQKPPGIGKKSAQRILLELKEKIDKFAWSEQSYEDLGPKEELAQDTGQEVIEGLLSLGYTELEARSAVKKLDPGMTVEELLKAALKILSKKR